MKRPIVVITGPTAVGKTELSLKLAPLINGEIINADSMQVYKGLDIGTDKVSRKVREKIPHHLIDILEPTESFSVSDFVKLAKNSIREIILKGKTPIVVGGTAFYIDSLLYGEPETPPPDALLRQKLSELTNEELYEKLLKVDPKTKIHPNDRKRLIRALEIYELSGMPPSSFSWKAKTPKIPFLGYFLLRDRQEIYERIKNRIEKQIEEGILREAKMLMELQNAPTAMQALGYKEFLPYLRGECTLEEAKERLIKRTKTFAKRQITWFKNRKDFKVLNLTALGYNRAVQIILNDLKRWKDEGRNSRSFPQSD